MPDSDLPHDWRDRAVAYFERRHRAGELIWFFAMTDAEPVGSAAAFLADGYPSLICTARRVGYIAGIFVKPAWRRRGVARGLTETSVAWLKQLGCTSIRLHAAEKARPLYESMGFRATNEMALRV